MQKVTIVGAGRVGESTAQFLASKDIAREVVLLDIKEGQAKGAALDIQETAPLLEFDSKVTGSTDFATLRDSELVIVTAGIPRKPGMSRSDVLETNVKILDGIIDNVLEYAPEAMLMLVSNPVDVLTYRAWRRTGWSRQRVFGQAGVLDSSRMAAFIAMETGFSSKDISAMVLGGHGDSMVSLARYTTISGIGIDQFLNEEQIKRIVERTRNGGAEIVGYLKTGSAYYAPSAAVAEMVDSIVHNKHRILPCAAWLTGEYGLEGMHMGVPVMLGSEGVEKVLELDLSEEEKAMLKASADSVMNNINKVAL